MKKLSVFCLPAMMMAAALLLFASCGKDNTTPAPAPAPEPAPTPTPEPAERVDLSANGCANCYIVSKAGRYQFKPYKGNSKQEVASITKAKVLWESFGTDTAPKRGEIIDNDVQMAYSPWAITFSTPAVLKNGNAVIAAMDSNDNILWSWHIWVCADYDPVAKGQDYSLGAGKMMDRNLGAISATPGDVGALGLLYQWGRKDPFLGSSAIGSSTNTALSTLEWPLSLESTGITGTFDYANANPTVFITRNELNGDWFYSGDDDRWEESKTIYDPCPPGWKVPAGGATGVWSKAAATSSLFSWDKWSNENKGINFSGKFGSADPIWYPAAGSISVDGNLLNVGIYGYWWSCDTTDSNAYRLRIYSNTDVLPTNDWPRAAACSVRCIQEQVQ